MRPGGGRSVRGRGLLGRGAEPEQPWAVGHQTGAVAPGVGVAGTWDTKATRLTIGLEDPRRRMGAALPSQAAPTEVGAPANPALSTTPAVHSLARGGREAETPSPTHTGAGEGREGTPAGLEPTPPPRSPGGQGRLGSRLISDAGFTRASTLTADPARLGGRTALSPHRAQRPPPPI